MTDIPNDDKPGFVVTSQNSALPAVVSFALARHTISQSHSKYCARPVPFRRA
jgi:hypothetical protein